MDGEAKKGATLFSLLCDRPEGETIELDIATPEEVRRVTLKALKR